MTQPRDRDLRALELTVRRVHGVPGVQIDGSRSPEALYVGVLVGAEMGAQSGLVSEVTRHHVDAAATVRIFNSV